MIGINENNNEIEDFKIEVKEENNPKYFRNKTGNIIIIEELKTDWDKRKLRDVYRDLTSLNSPFEKSKEGFLVKIT